MAEEITSLPTVNEADEAWDEVDSFIDAATDEIANYELRNIVLNTEKILGLVDPGYPLEWKSISFGKEQIQDVPKDKRGFYAFVVARPQDFLPPHGYVMYIGIAGKNSHRPLRDRYRDYLNPTDIVTRPRIARMISRWRNILRFHFAAVGDEVSTEQLQAFEIRLNTAFLPPCAKGDIEADTKKMRTAFQ